MESKSAPKRIFKLAKSVGGFCALALIVGLIGFNAAPRAAHAAKQTTPRGNVRHAGQKPPAAKLAPRTTKSDPNQVSGRTSAPGALQTVFTNAGSIAINDDDVATPYPSTIAVSGLSGTIPATAGSVKVTLNNVSHTFINDVGMVLVGPTGAAILLQDGAGGADGISGVTYTLSDDGATQLPEAAWGPGTYQPTSYFTGDSFPAPGPGTTYNTPGPAGPGTSFGATFGGTAPNGTWSLYVVDFVAGDDGAIAGGWSLTINTGSANCTTVKRPVDMDGDGKTDFQVVRNTGGGASGQITWFTENVATGGAGSATPWGLASDRFLPADYDGDGKSDFAVWRGVSATQAFFYILQSGTNTLKIVTLGQNSDNPSVIGDYDGDGKVDPAVYRAGVNAGDPSFWLYFSSVTNSMVTVPWGQNGDFPAPGDFDGDGKADFAVQRNAGGGQAVFFFQTTTTPMGAVIFGTPTDVIVPGYYDSDCKTDIATIRGSGGQILWNVLNSTNGSITGTIWGNSATDFPVQGDYDGDGKTDLAVWRPNAGPGLTAYFYLGSGSSTQGSFLWGANGDLPTANYNSH